MTATQIQADQLLEQIQKSINELDRESKEFMQLALADFYLKAADDDIETADAAVKLLEEDVIPFVSEELEFELGATHKEIFAEIVGYLRKEESTLKAIKEIETISDNLADEIEG